MTDEEDGQPGDQRRMEMVMLANEISARIRAGNEAGVLQRTAELLVLAHEAEAGECSLGPMEARQIRRLTAGPTTVMLVHLVGNEQAGEGPTPLGSVIPTVWPPPGVQG